LCRLISRISNAGYALRRPSDYNTSRALPDNECHACPPGHYNGIVGAEQCAACASGRCVSANASTSVADCAECGVNTFSAAGAGGCTLCAEDSQAPAASSDKHDCVCNAGFTGRPGGPCASCGAGKYKLDEG